MKKRFFAIGLAVLISCTHLRAADGAGLGGIYQIAGSKGPIVLVLQIGENGNLTGSLKGGDLQATLKGFPAKSGGVLGTLTGPDGKFLSYFQIAREGDKVEFDIVQANAANDPDFTKKSRLTFPANEVKPEAPKPDAPKPTTEPTTPAVNFGGTFKGDMLVLESKAESAGYSGTIKLAGDIFKFTGAANETTLRGEFESPDGKFPFEAKLEGRILTFTTEGTIYLLTKQGNPLAKPVAVALPNPLAKPDVKTPDPTPLVPPDKSNDGRAAWRIYKHETGLSVRYPPDWNIEVRNNIAMLTPPNVAQSENGPIEFYLLLANPSQGTSRMDDPQMVPYIESYVQKIAPFLQRVGATQKVMDGATPGLLLSWEGTNPRNMAVRANVMATVLKGFSIALLAMGDKDKIAARENVLKDIFSSLAAGAGERDAQIFGSWKFGISKNSGGTSSTETTRRLRFFPNGTCVWQNSGIGLSQDNEGERGQWTAANGHLFVLWADGTSGTWNYEMRASENGKRLLLKGADTKAHEWAPDD